MDPGAIIAAILSIIDEVIQFVLDLLNALIGLLDQVFSFIWNTLVNVVGVIASLFQKIAAFFVHLWQDYIKPAIDGLLHLYQKIHDWLQQFLGPVLRIIQRLRAWFYKYIYPWIKLAQQIISVVRAMLAALRILGVKWAAKLDADLAKIQGYITTALQDIVGTLNQASTWLNFAIDPAGLFRKQVFSNTAFANLATMYRSVNWGKNRGLSASEAQNTQDDISLAGGGANVLTRNADGSVTYSDASQRINANASKAWNSFGAPKV